MILTFVKKPLILIATLIGFGCFPLPAQRGEFTPQEFEEMTYELASDKVALIETSEIKKEYKILDAREPKEYEVSHLEGAHYIGYDNFNIENLPSGLDLNDTIVVYCSVGYRSGKIGEKLQKAGYRNVYNLRGGLFKWANEGKPLSTPDNTSTQQVHGFNKKWSKWLLKEIPTVY